MARAVTQGVHCILPPHLVEKILLNGNPAQREWALATLSVDHSLRTARVGASRTPESEPAQPRSLSALAPVKQVTIYDAETGHRLPGRRVRGEGDPPSPTDDAVNEAFDYLTDTWDFFLAAYGRNSLDGNGLALNGSVHYQKFYDNAFWDGQRMVFGDGDALNTSIPPNQRLFESFTKCIDVIGHELTHGVTEYEAGLIYWSQPGALNESLSDVFGSLVKQYAANEKADQADWLIGEGLLTPAVQGEALRSMKAPGSAYDDDVLGEDPQPAHMDDYVTGIADNGGVHINSGIPNHAFYLAATNIGGFAWEEAGLIWYSTLLSPYLRRTAKFLAFAKLTVYYAGSLFPGTDTAAAVTEAWREVGINA
jgi:Zn-dependent metalloprotease